MTELRLSGSGGQGLILIGIILAEAAIYDNKLAIQSQSYGPEARGGASKAEVIIAEKPIHYPKVTCPDLVLAMTQEAANKYCVDLAAEGTLLIDTTFVRDVPGQIRNVLALPITQLAKEKLGKALFANIVALGAIVALTRVVSVEAVTRAVLDRVPRGTEALNRQALELGMSLVNGK